MRIVLVQLTQTEASDAAVMRNIVSLLEHGDTQFVGNESGVTLTTPPPSNLLPAPLAADAALPPTAPVDDSAARAAAAFGGAPVAPATAMPPAASAAPATTPPAPPTGPGVRDVDAAGFPWDARIHAEPPSKTDKGIWRASRKAGASAAKPQVEAELRALGYGVISPPPPPAPVAQPGLTPEQQAQLLAAQVQQQAAPMPMPPAPAPVAAAPVAPAGAERSFEALMMRVQAGVGMKVIGHDWLKTNYVPKGIPNIMTLMQAPAAIGELHQMLDLLEVPDHVKS